MKQHRHFERYVAIGDSSTEGIDDPDGSGGYRGWSRRLAQRIADAQGDLGYANFGVRGLTTREILEQQLAPALALSPDLATVFSGTNDVTGRRFDAEAVALDMEDMQRALMAGGATVLTFTLPDLTPVMPLARLIAPRIRALNARVRAATARTGTILLDFAAYPVASDPRVWSADRIHANALGHARIADALADALGLPGSDGSWRAPLPPMARKSRADRLADEFRWIRRHLQPWIARGRRSGPAEPRSLPTLAVLRSGVPIGSGLPSSFPPE